MSVELAIVGGPFVDLVFDGLGEAIAPGREVVGRRFRVAPGGTAMQAIAAARSGASVALVAPRGDDVFGTMLADLLGADGVGWAGPRAPSTSVTAVLIGPTGTAMATAKAPSEPSVDDVASLAPRGVVASIRRRALAPAGSAVYLVTGQVEMGAGALGSGPSLAGVGPGRALIVNGAEAHVLTGERDAAAASRVLVDVADIVVVTLGDRGAIASTAGTTIHVGATAVSTGDATGAGDVFAGAFAAADVQGADLADALEHAVAMAGRAAAGTTAYEGLASRDT